MWLRGKNGSLKIIFIALSNFYLSCNKKFKWIARWTSTWNFYLWLRKKNKTLFFFIIINSQMCIKMLSFSFVMKIAFSKMKKWHFMFASWHIFMTFCTSGRIFYEFNSLTCENFHLLALIFLCSLAVLAEIFLAE